MITSPSRFALFDHAAEPIPMGTLGYIRARGKRSVFTTLVEQFEKSGLKQAQIARRLSMDRALVSRYLGTPANWEFETLCDLFFAVSGAVITLGLSYPRERSKRAADEAVAETVATAFGDLNEQVTPALKFSAPQEQGISHTQKTSGSPTIASVDVHSLYGMALRQQPAEREIAVPNPFFEIAGVGAWTIADPVNKSIPRGVEVPEEPWQLRSLLPTYLIPLQVGLIQ